MPRPPTPAGFGSWLDYAVETMDTRTALMEHLSKDEGQWSQESIKQAVRDELTELRRRAAKSTG